MIESVSTIVSIKEEYRVVKVTLNSSDDALMVGEGIDGCEFDGKCLNVSVKRKKEGGEEGRRGRCEGDGVMDGGDGGKEREREEEREKERIGMEEWKDEERIRG